MKTYNIKIKKERKKELWHLHEVSLDSFRLLQSTSHNDKCESYNRTHFGVSHSK